MLEWIGKKLRKNQGFTLIELVVVIAILAILVAIAIPKLEASRKNAAVTAHNANVRTIESAANMYIADGRELPITAGDGKIEGDNHVLADYLQEAPKVPKGIESNETYYKIEISEDGKITVNPGPK
ncbi:MAG TPA: type II secretion system protein [Tepidimicrobium sp.]|nr:type II secretion system protein [Tepidimicrobium sp.]